MTKTGQFEDRKQHPQGLGVQGCGNSNNEGQGDVRRGLVLDRRPGAASDQHGSIEHLTLWPLKQAPVTNAQQFRSSKVIKALGLASLSSTNCHISGNQSFWNRRDEP